MKEKLRQRLLQVFQAEHADHVGVMRQLLPQIGPDAAGQAALNEVFRRAHSLKGAARAVDLPVIQSLAHQLETLFARMQRQEMPFADAPLRLMEQVIDLSEDLVQAFLQGTPPPDHLPLLNALESLLGLELTPPPEPPAAEPETPAADPGATPAAAAPEAPAPLINELMSDQLRISAARFEGLLANADRLQVECQRQDQMEQLCGRLLLQLAELDDHCRQHWSELRDTTLAEGLSRRLEALNGLGRSLRLQQRQSSWKLDQEVASLQQGVRQIRILPVRDLFQSFPRMLRELAREQGKEIETRFSGLDIEADRAVLQAIKDPVMHILRNALSHGIESPEQRQVHGKLPAGRIECEVETRGHQLLIRIRDDGRGLDQEKIRSQAQQAALGARLADGEDWRAAIFQPGFSTAAGVTELHGRGMGLSVVAETLARLQGEYRILPTSVGFAIELEMPLHIATSHVLQIRVGQQIFALPTANIDALLRVKPESLELLEGRPVLRFERAQVPLHSLSQLIFHQPPLAAPQLPAIVFRSARQQLALTVDAFLGDYETVLKPLSGPAQGLPLYLGAMLSPQGMPIPVFDPHALLQLCQGQPLTELPLLAMPDTSQLPSILVVDDSITTRTLEKSILETQGFRVAVAVNGLEALEKLRASHYDLVITDVQMPEMNGLELLEAMKHDAALSTIPVIMVTSLQEEEDRKRGLQLGADAYLVKQRFEQQELLEVIHQLL